MKQIIPNQLIERGTSLFPVVGEDCNKLTTVVSMELFGCSLGEVSRQLGCSVDEVMDIIQTEDYAFVKRKMIESVRTFDRKSLDGRILQEADNAFERMKDLANDAQREDVKFNANKDLLDRALVSGVKSGMNGADELRITIVKRN